MFEKDDTKIEAVSSSLELVSRGRCLPFARRRTVTLNSPVHCTEGFGLSVVYMNDTW